MRKNGIRLVPVCAVVIILSVRGFYFKFTSCVMEAKKNSNISLGAILPLVCGVPAILICYWALLIEYFKVTSLQIDINSLWKEDIFFLECFFSLF